MTTKTSNDRGERGKPLERAVMKLFTRYEERGIHCQQNHPETLGNGQRVSKHGYDFQIMYKNIFYAFDAKMSAKAKMDIRNLKPHQVSAMAKIEAHGGVGFFLVFFKEENTLVKIPVAKVIEMLAGGRKSFNSADGIPTKLNFLDIGMDE